MATALDVQLFETDTGTSRVILWRGTDQSVYDLTAKQWIAAPDSGAFTAATVLSPTRIGTVGNRYFFLVPALAIVTSRNGIQAELYKDDTAPAIEKDPTSTIPIEPYKLTFGIN